MRKVAAVKIEKLEIFINKNRSSHRGCSVGKGVLRNFVNFTGKHRCQSFFFNKVAGLKPKFLKTFFAKFLEHLFYRARMGDCFYKNYDIS